MTTSDDGSRDVRVVSVNISIEKGTMKTPVPEIAIDDEGVSGDAHRGTGHRQVSMLAGESIDRFAAETGRRFSPGEFAENITTRGLDFACVGVLDRFGIGDLLTIDASVLTEVIDRDADGLVMCVLTGGSIGSNKAATAAISPARFPWSAFHWSIRRSSEVASSPASRSTSPPI